MIVKGYISGIDQPDGINWELNYNGKGSYEYTQSLIEDPSSRFDSEAKSILSK